MSIQTKINSLSVTLNQEKHTCLSHHQPQPCDMAQEELAHLQTYSVPGVDTWLNPDFKCRNKEKIA